MNGVGISKFGATVKDAPDGRAGEWCIKVLLRSELPEELKLPEEYKGVPISIEYVGTIKLLRGAHLL